MGKKEQKKELREQQSRNIDSLKEKLSLLSKRVSVVLVEPKYQGNIGAVARGMVNAGLSSLYIVGTAKIEEEARIRALYGSSVLDSAKFLDTLEDLPAEIQILAATAGDISLNHRKFRRIPIYPWEFWSEQISTVNRIALIFGREDDGLSNSEAELCNYFITIPANPLHPSYNLSHAVSIILYEMVKSVYSSAPIGRTLASGIDLRMMEQKIQGIIDNMDYPEHKINNTMTMIRRIMARSNLTETEYFKLMGVLSYVEKALSER